VRPLVLPADETVTVEVLSPTEELILTIDGQEHERLVSGQKVVARRAEQPVRLVRFAGQTFFQTLRPQAQVGRPGGTGGDDGERPGESAGRFVSVAGPQGCIPLRSGTRRTATRRVVAVRLASACRCVVG
jgi:hypothetical protein